MYITSADGLRQELEHRRTRREEIREKTRAFLLRRYGLEEIPNILPPPIWQEAQSKTVAILARQVASVCIEDITFEVGAKKTWTASRNTYVFA